ncbi:MAG: hypothetical protein HY901_17970, partial [Deltaproteobacteria bacterium]|nr:hypothetical protein [Deltaproteobacteria bacterium]
MHLDRANLNAPGRVLGCALLVMALATGCTGEARRALELGSQTQSVSGKDGDKVIAANVVEQPNAYATLSANAAVGATSIQVSNIADLGTLAAGDLLLIIQMQGATINSADTTSYGAVTANGSSGLYELIPVASVAGNIITLDTTCGGGLKNAYTVAGKTQVLRVPQYDNLTINNLGTITAPAWNGSKGGVVALHVKNTVTLNGTIEASALGFRGGAAGNQTL